MAKLIKYDHFERHTGHIICRFYDISNVDDHDLILKCRYLGASPSDGDLAYTMTSAAFRSVYKNCLTQIECADLENEAKTTRKVTYLSFNFVLPTSCRLSPYYSLSLSRISSTSLSGGNLVDGLPPVAS